TNTRKMHLPGFQAIEGVEVVSVCNRSEASSRKVAEAFGIPKIAHDWGELIADPEIDAVCIGTWPYLHAPCTIAALKAGKHVLTEARMAMDLAEAEQMLDAARANPELVAQIVPAPFSLKYDATIQRLLAEGVLGKIREVRVAHFMDASADATAPMNWRQDIRYSGKNTMMLGIHYETVQRWLGVVDPQWVQAGAAIFTQTRTDAETGDMRPVEIPEALNVTAGYADGSQLVMNLSSVARGMNYLSFRIDGERASLRYDINGNVLYLTEQGQAEHALEPEPGEAGTWNVEADFVTSIREGSPVSLTSFAEGVRYMRFTERVWDSWNAARARLDF
ncbi:MAG: Gfo/Idh/MocA family oxidoreductase, partial [Verrucomicrobiota bacterium]